MAWVTRINGTDERWDLASEITLSGNFRIVIENFRYITAPTGADIGGVTGRLSVYDNFAPCAIPSVGGWALRINDNTYTFSSATVPIPTSSGVTYEFKRTSSTGTLTVDGASEAVSVTTSAFTLGVFGTLNATDSPSTHYGNIEMGNISIYDSSDTLIHYFDADNSDHGLASPIWDNTIGSDATGINVDASTWIDLGGGGVTFLPSWLTNFNQII
jgi:hypothetical protein